MKKSILVFAAVALLAGCSTTHYAKDERYIQSGHDCIVKVDEWGVISRTNSDKYSRVVYPNTHCAEVMNKKSTAVEPTTTSTVKRVYLRNNCNASYGTWCY